MIHRMLLMAMQQQPDTADFHGAFREAVAVVYREAFSGQHSASNVRIDLGSFKRMANMSGSADLSDVIQAIGKPATVDMRAMCGARYCPSIRARTMRRSGDSLFAYFDVARYTNGQPGELTLEFAGFVAAFVRISGKFKLAGVAQDAMS